MNKKVILTIAGLTGIMSIGVIAANMPDASNVETTDIGPVIANNENLNVIFEDDFRVVELKENGILIGDENGNLQLESTLKRQEMVVLISRLMGKEAEAKLWNTNNLTFKDVEKDNWAAPYIAWAKDNNITKGYSEEEFGYDDTLTEIQTGIFLLRVLGYTEADMDNASELASEVSIIGYYDELSENSIIRAKVAEMIYNTIYCRLKESNILLSERLNIKSEYTESERNIALKLKEYGIDFYSMTESNGWKIMYVSFNEKTINSQTINEELALYSLVGSYIDYSHYVLVDIETNKKMEVINYKEYGVIYQIKYDNKVIYEYTEE